MGNLRRAHLPTSGDDDEDEVPLVRKSVGDRSKRQRKRKLVQFPDEDDEDKEIVEPKRSEGNANKENRGEPENQGEDAENEDSDDVDARPVGDVLRVSGKGRMKKKNHYRAFEYDGNQYEINDSVLLVPEDRSLKPYVAIIKDITQVKGEAVMITGQWFYRPEEAEKKGGGNWKSRDTRELFYSFHRDDVPAESVMHRCVVHFIPKNKQIPKRQEHPGFFVQKVYDTELRRLFKLTDKDYEEGKQEQIDILVKSTLERLGDLPDLEPEDAAIDHEDDTKNKRLFRKRNISHLDVTTKEEEGLDRPPSLKAETPVSVGDGASEYYTILANFKMLTGETQRDKWLEKLLQAIQFICLPKQDNEEGKGDIKNSGANNKDEPNKVKNHGTSFEWPDSVVPAIVGLEKTAHETLSADYQKYNQKMRQLNFNLNKNDVLARRLLNKELAPTRILNMLPQELKNGYTDEELASREPEEPRRMQMTDARCSRCSEKKVGLRDIIQAGNADRYQLECIGCGNTWYASRDAVAALTIEDPKSNPPVSTAPEATTKAANENQHSK